MQLNPIIKKDIRVNSRSVKLSLGVCIYELVLALILFLTLSIIEASTTNNYYYPDNIYHSMLYIFPVLGVTQACIVALITPILTASSISGERERQTFDIMLTTCLSPMQIILGKVATAVLRVLLYVIASIPIMGLSFIIGGIPWATLFWYMVCITILAILAGSIGILCSSLCNKTISSVILSFIFYAVIGGATCIPMVLDLITFQGDIKESPLFLLINPIFLFEEFFMLSLSNRSLFGALNGADSYFGRECGVIVQLLSNGRIWLILSGICMLLLSYVFVLAAAKQINPLYVKKVKKEKTKKNAK